MVTKDEAQLFLRHMQNTLTAIAKEKTDFKYLPSGKWVIERSGKLGDNKRFAWFAILSDDAEDIKKALESMYKYYGDRGFKINYTTSSEQL